MLLVGALMLAALAAPAAAPDPITTFTGGIDDVTVGFRDAISNSSASIDLPRGATITSASMAIEGIALHGDDVRQLDFAGWCATADPDRAWGGYVLGNYPPSYPYWDPYSPPGSAFAAAAYGDIGASDDVRFRTVTPASWSGEYPFHLFRLKVPDGTVTRLDVRWEGQGYCLANQTTRGAELFLWRNTTRGWEKGEWYSKTEGAQDRVLERAYTTDAASYVDGDRQLFLLVYGKRSDTVAGPNPWTAEGEVQTDYVRVNVTLEGPLEYLRDVDISVEGASTVWSMPGTFSGATAVSGSVVRNELQRALDTFDVVPGNATVRLWVNVSAQTAGVIRLHTLQVGYTPVVNAAPAWGSVPRVTTLEDTDAVHALDLDTVTMDDHNAGALSFEVARVSSTAIRAVIEDRHWLTVRIAERDWHGIASLTLNATDAFGLMAQSPDIVVEVFDVNDPPTVKAPGILNGRQGDAFEYHFVASDVDGDTLEYSDDCPVFEVDPATGAVAFTPTNDDVGLHEFNVTASDGRGGTAVGRGSLVIANVNDPPSISDPGPLRGRQGAVFRHAFEATDPDLPYGDLLRWTLLGDPYYVDNLLLDPMTGELVWPSITNAEVGTHQFQLKVVDTGGKAAQLDVVLTIDNLNDPPSFQRIGDQPIAEDGTLSVSIKVLDPDLAVDPAERLTWTVEPPWFTVSPAGNFIYKALREHAGETRITITVTDTAGSSYSQSFSLIVQLVNHPPSFTPVADQVAVEDTAWFVDLVITDIDANDTIMFTGTAPFPIPQAGGRVMWTPRQNDVGDNPVRIEAADAAGAVAVLAFDLTVLEVDDPPTVLLRSPVNGSAYNFHGPIPLRAEGTDEEGKHLTYEWSWRYESRGTSTWKPVTTGPDGLWTMAPPGRLVLRVTASDGNHTATGDVTVEVASPPDERGSGAGIVIAAGVVLLVVVILLVVMRARRHTPPKPPSRERPKEEAWEEFED